MSVHPPFLGSLLSFLPAIFGPSIPLLPLLIARSPDISSPVWIAGRLPLPGTVPSRCVQILDGSSVPGCPLLLRTKSREGALNRPKGAKRDRSAAVAGGKVPTATYRRKWLMRELGWSGDSGNNKNLLAPQTVSNYLHDYQKLTCLH